MAYTDGILNIDGKLIDMTGETNYTTGGTDLGIATVDPMRTLFKRDVRVYTRMDSGSSPRFAAIVGEEITLSLTLANYNANTLNLWSQRHADSGEPNNYHFLLGSGYNLGHLLDSGDLISLMIRDDAAPGDKPALYLPACVVIAMGPHRWTRDGEHTDELNITIMALHDGDFGSVGAYGDLASFPAL